MHNGEEDERPASIRAATTAIGSTAKIRPLQLSRREERDGADCKSAIKFKQAKPTRRRNGLVVVGRRSSKLSILFSPRHKLQTTPVDQCLSRQLRLIVLFVLMSLLLTLSPHLVSSSVFASTAEASTVDSIPLSSLTTSLPPARAAKLTAAAASTEPRTITRTRATATTRATTEFAPEPKAVSLLIGTGDNVQQLEVDNEETRQLTIDSSSSSLSLSASLSPLSLVAAAAQEATTLSTSMVRWPPFEGVPDAGCLKSLEAAEATGLSRTNEACKQKEQRQQRHNRDGAIAATAADAADDNKSANQSNSSNAQAARPSVAVDASNGRSPAPNKCNSSKLWGPDCLAGNDAAFKGKLSPLPQKQQNAKYDCNGVRHSDKQVALREPRSEAPVERQINDADDESANNNNKQQQRRPIEVKRSDDSLNAAEGNGASETESSNFSAADGDGDASEANRAPPTGACKQVRPERGKLSRRLERHKRALNVDEGQPEQQQLQQGLRRREQRTSRRVSASSPQHSTKRRQLGGAVAADQIITHRNLIEPNDDDLFLVAGSRALGADDTEREADELAALEAATCADCSSGLAAGRRPRLATDSTGPLGSDAESQVQTIYFGGFFPWLTDEDTRFMPPAGNARATSNHRAPEHRHPQQAHNHHEQQQQQASKKPLRKRKQQQTSQQQQPYENATLAFASPSALASVPLTTTSPSAAMATATAMAMATATAPTTARTGTSATTNDVADNNWQSRHQLGRFILPAVRLALDHINNNSTVLGAYRLEIVPRDTQCNATISLKQFFDMVYEEPKKMLLYGDACRVSTDPIAKASYFFDLIQISYADTDPIYTIENYPNFFRVVPSENALSLARIPFIRHFNWTRVGTIYQNLPRYSLPHSKLLTDLERYSIVIKQSVSLSGSVDGLQNRDLGDELRKLKEKDVRIILGNFDEEWALLLFCEAFREKMTGRKYQWILTGVSEDKLWQHYKSKGSSCSEQELLVAMDGYIITDITPVTRSQRRTISGMMAHEYSNEYRRRAEEMSISIEENKFYGYVYDGIWAIALALHRVDYQLKYYNKLAEAGRGKLNPEIEGLTSLLDFDYHRPIWVKLIRNALNKTRFSGVTGTVSFHKNERPGLISFSQFQAFRDMNEVIIGSYDALNDELDLNVGFPIFWRGPSPPIDYTIQRVTPFRINRTLFVIISILALFGIVLAFVFLTINIKFRNQRYIKMSSPYLNNLIIIGCILTYTSVIILGLDSGLTSEYNFPYICNARAWVLMAGFTLAFGSMFSKTFRVHSIFTNIKLHKKVIKDYKLFMVVFILLTFDICILIVWQYFDPFYRETNNGTSIQDSDNEDVIIVPEMEHCQSKRMTIFLSVIYVYKGLLMAFGCFLAWETRHVSIPALNDSKYIGLSVYNVVIMCVIGASLSFVLRDQQDASFVIISIFIIFCSTTTLCLVFVPKLIELKQNPRAGDHRVRATLKTFKKNYHEEAIGAAASCRDLHGNIIHGRGFGVNLNARIKILLDENVKQRSVLKEKTYELEALTYKYRKIQSMVQSGQYLQVINSTIAGTTIGSSTGLSTMQQSLASPSSMPTALVLTGRSPTQERVSFASILKDDGKLQQQAGSDTCLAAAAVTNAGLANVNNATASIEPRGTLRKSPIMSSAVQIITTNTTNSSFNNATDLTVDYSSSRVISNATTSTTTTTNNGYDDKTAAVSLDGQGKRALVAFDCTATDANNRKQQQLLAAEKRATFVIDTPDDQQQQRRQPTVVAVNYAQNLIQANQDKQALILSTGSPKKAGGASTIARRMKQSPECTTDSSYCSMGADYEISGAHLKPGRIQDDSSNLFTVFSYISNSSGVPTGSSGGANNSATDGSGSRRRRRQMKIDLAEDNFSRWSEGPFCTLMVRNRDQQQMLRSGPQAAQQYARYGGSLIAPGEAILKSSREAANSSNTAAAAAGGLQELTRVAEGATAANTAKHPNQIEAHSNETRASCPNIATKLAATNSSATAYSASERQQQQQQSSKGQLDVVARRQMSQQNEIACGQSRSSMQTVNQRTRLPRTLSMIEYLGLNEFDLIARRHDKLLKRKLSRRQQQHCCCENSTPCTYCSRTSQLGRNGQQQQHKCHMQQFEGDLEFSSSDLLNSGELLQTSSHLSCSTCCSLASQSYASQSELFDETRSSDQSASSQTEDSSSVASGDSYGAQQHYSSNSQSSTRSSSTVDQQQDNQQATRYCIHHPTYSGQPQARGVHHHHSHHHHHHGGHHHHHHSSEAISSATSSSSIYIHSNNNQQQQQQHQKTATASSEHSLCTSGALYCAPGAKEDANSSATQIAQTGASTSVAAFDADNQAAVTEQQQQAGISNLAVEDSATEDDEQRQIFSIKCDVLESL